MAAPAHSIKIALIGNSGSGKSCLLKRFAQLDDSARQQQQVDPGSVLPKVAGPSLSVSFAARQLCVGVGQDVRVEVWDTPGAQHLLPVTKLVCHGAAAVVVAVDVQAQQQQQQQQQQQHQTYGSEYLATCVNPWLELAAEMAPNAPIVVCGTKADGEAPGPVATSVPDTTSSPGSPPGPSTDLSGSGILTPSSDRAFSLPEALQFAAIHRLVYVETSSASWRYERLAAKPFAAAAHLSLNAIETGTLPLQGTPKLNRAARIAAADATGVDVGVEHEVAERASPPHHSAADQLTADEPLPTSPRALNLARPVVPSPLRSSSSSSSPELPSPPPLASGQVDLISFADVETAGPVASPDNSHEAVLKDPFLEHTSIDNKGDSGLFATAELVPETTSLLVSTADDPLRVDGQSTDGAESGGENVIAGASNTPGRVLNNSPAPGEDGFFDGARSPRQQKELGRMVSCSRCHQPDIAIVALSADLGESGLMCASCVARTMGAHRERAREQRRSQYSTGGDRESRRKVKEVLGLERERVMAAAAVARVAPELAAASPPLNAPMQRAPGGAAAKKSVAMAAAPAARAAAASAAAVVAAARRARTASVHGPATSVNASHAYMQVREQDNGIWQLHSSWKHSRSSSSSSSSSSSGSMSNASPDGSPLPGRRLSDGTTDQSSSHESLAHDHHNLEHHGDDDINPLKRSSDPTWTPASLGARAALSLRAVLSSAFASLPPSPPASPVHSPLSARRHRPAAVPGSDTTPQYPSSLGTVSQPASPSKSSFSRGLSLSDRIAKFDLASVDDGEDTSDPGASDWDNDNDTDDDDTFGGRTGARSVDRRRPATARSAARGSAASAYRQLLATETRQSPGQRSSATASSGELAAAAVLPSPQTARRQRASMTARRLDADWAAPALSDQLAQVVDDALSASIVRNIASLSPLNADSDPPLRSTGARAICVAVTGATGFLGTHVCAALLAQGFMVNATVRSLHGHNEAVVRLRQLPGASAGVQTASNASRHRSTALQVFEASLEGDRANYERALAGCWAVVHCASPTSLFRVGGDEGRTVEQTVRIAVEGARHVFAAALAVGTVQRFVLPSPLQTVCETPEPGHLYTAADFNARSTVSSNPAFYAATQVERELRTLAAYASSVWAHVDASGAVDRVSSPDARIWQIAVNSGLSAAQLWPGQVPRTFLDSAPPPVSEGARARFEFISICAPMLLGPALTARSTTSVGPDFLRGLLCGESKTIPENVVFHVGDVRAVSAAVVRAATVVNLPCIRGPATRMLLPGQPLPMASLVDAIASSEGVPVQARNLLPQRALRGMVGAALSRVGSYFSSGQRGQWLRAHMVSAAVGAAAVDYTAAASSASSPSSASNSPSSSPMVGRRMSSHDGTSTTDRPGSLLTGSSASIHSASSSSFGDAADMQEALNTGSRDNNGLIQGINESSISALGTSTLDHNGPSNGTQDQTLSAVFRLECHNCLASLRMAQVNGPPAGPVYALPWNPEHAVLGGERPSEAPWLGPRSWQETVSDTVFSLICHRLIPGSMGHALAEAGKQGQSNLLDPFSLMSRFLATAPRNPVQKDRSARGSGANGGGWSDDEDGVSLGDVDSDKESSSGASMTSDSDSDTDDDSSSFFSISLSSSDTGATLSSSATASAAAAANVANANIQFIGDEDDGREQFSCPVCVLEVVQIAPHDLIRDRRPRLVIRHRRFVVGRSQACDYRFADSKVSSFHFELEFLYDRGHPVVAVIRDKSKRGTFLNGRRLNPDEAAPLEPGAIISLVKKPGKKASGVLIVRELRNWPRPPKVQASLLGNEL